MVEEKHSLVHSLKILHISSLSMKLDLAGSRRGAWGRRGGAVSSGFEGKDELISLLSLGIAGEKAFSLWSTRTVVSLGLP